MSYGTGRSGFNKALDKGTSPTLSEPDWDAIVAICDFVRSGEIKPKYAVDNIMKKISQDSQSVAKNALQILESIVKNCGPKVHDEVGNPSFMEFMKQQAKVKTDSVKAKILELIQCWSHAFRDNPDYKAVTDTFNELKHEGFSFPQLREADAMFTSEVLPDWKDGEVCFSCRTAFGTFNRKHHCRACGQIFDNKCSSKRSEIPKFGIEKEVRVCDGCYAKLNPPSSTPASGGSKDRPNDSDLPTEYLNSELYKQSQKEATTPKPEGGKSKEEIEEEEQLQLALAISQSEAEAKDKEKKRRQAFMSLDATPPGQSPAPPKISAPVVELEEQHVSPELQKYLNRNYWENKQKEVSAPSQNKVVVEESRPVSVVTTPSAPPPSFSEPTYTSVTSESQGGDEETVAAETNGLPDENDEEREQFMQALSSSIDVFLNRMTSNSMRGRSIINDSAVQTLFATLQNMHPQLLNYIQGQEDRRSHFEGLQDKLAQLKDARDALTSLRQEHEEKRRIEAEERAKRKQIQMMQKLDVLRKQKQVALDRQRMAAMQRLQQQEAEMAARMEQQKQLAQMRQMQMHGFPQDLQTNYNVYGQMPGDYQQQVGYNPSGMPGPQMAAYPQQYQTMAPGQPGQLTEQPPTGYAPEQPQQQGVPNQPQPYSTPAQQPGYQSMQPPPYEGGYQPNMYAGNAYDMQGLNATLPGATTQPMNYQSPGQPYNTVPQQPTSQAEPDLQAPPMPSHLMLPPAFNQLNQPPQHGQQQPLQHGQQQPQQQLPYQQYPQQPPPQQPQAPQQPQQQQYEQPPQQQYEQLISFD